MSELTGPVRIPAARWSPPERTRLLQATCTNSEAACAALLGGGQTSLFLRVTHAGQENTVHRTEELRWNEGGRKFSVGPLQCKWLKNSKTAAKKHLSPASLLKIHSFS